MEFFDQSEQLKNFTKHKKVNEKIAKLVAITSGKGGVGKSNFILNLAIAMSIRGKKVLLIDADMNLSNLDVLTGVYAEHSITAYLDSLITLDELLIEGPKGVKILPAASGDIRIMQSQGEIQKALIQIYRDLQVEYDYILIDTGAGISDYTLEFVLSADKIIVISTPEPTSITDAYAMIKVLHYRKKEPNIYMVINMAQTDNEGKNIFNKVNLIIRHFLNKQINHLGSIPYDRYLPEAVKEQVPIIIKRPRSVSSANIHNIAMTLLKEDK
ncbi:MAG: hypothetical protein CSB55_03195 [Candidatus Cloacimonadota bacterium]|nr:MAG: hypothetical protein CSB55_03195 [Candidatus Cloacimonadota bacterium]